MKKKILSVILACCMTLTMMTPMVYAEETTEVTAEEQENDSTEEVIQDEPVEEAEVENDIESFSDEVEDTEETGIAVQSTDLPSEIYLTQQGSSTCTMAASAMMLRARFYKSNNSSWRSITESSIRSTAWVDGTGLRHSWTYKIDNNSVSVNHSSVSGISVSSLKSLLNNHPEGIVLYCGKLPHAVFLTDYDGDTFYCADPLSSYSGKRLALSSSYLGKKYGSQASVLSNVTAYWYVSSYSINTGNSEAESISYGFDNPINNEVLTEKSFLFQGWVDSSKEISSITCSINHGAHYVTTNLYKRSDVLNATAFRIEANSNLLNIGENDIALCVNFTDGTGKVLENRTVTWSPKLLWGFDSPGEEMQISDNQFQFSGWIETARNLDSVTCSLNHGEQYFTANLYTRSDVPNATAFRLDIGTSNLKYGENYVAVCAHYADGTGETIAEHKVRKCINDVVEYPQNDEKFTYKDSKFLLQGWSTDETREIDHFEFTINESRYTTAAHTRSDLTGNARYYREEVPTNRLKSGDNTIEIFAYYKDGTSRNIGKCNVVKVPDVSNAFKDDFYAKIQNATTGTVLTRVDGEETKDVKFSEDTNAREQIWHFVKNGGSDSYTISCEDDEAMALDVYSGTDEDKAKVLVWTKNGSKAQQWTILDNDGNYCLKPGCSELRVLDTPGGNGGTQNAQIYSYNSGPGAKMNIVEVEPTKTKLQNENLVSSGNYNQHRYEVFDQEMTWSDAERACEAAGGHLVSITDAEEQKFVESLLEKAGMQHYWIGMYSNLNTYKWITGESNDYTNWNTGEPNGISSEQAKEYCGEMLNTSGSKGLWNDLSNSPQEKVGVICEYDSIKNYTLTYDANGGTNAPEKKTDEQDAILKVSEDTPIRRGYRFLGWSTDKDAEKAEYQANDEIKLTKDITLYAVWEKMDATGTCGEKVSWELDQQGVLTIYGEGAMKNYTYKSEMPWYKYLSKIQKVVIEKGVTTIGDYAFYGMTDTTEITIPEGVTTIGEYAFKNSTKIAEITLPSTLKKLGQSAFYGCTSLSKIAIPEGLYTIWGYTFKNCTSLAEVTLPSTLIKIDEAAFYGCSSLKKIKIPEDVSIIGIYCFKNCSNLSEISLPESMTKIREAAFYGTAITEITIPDSVTAIGSYAFKNCTKLKKVNLSKELKSIEESAFYACESMTKLILPSKVTTIGDYAFRRCVGLQVVEFSDSLKKIGESAFYGCSDLSELVLPEGMTEIGGYAFKSCTNVTSVSLPSTLNVIGESGFYGCDRIESIEIPAGLNAIGDYAFSRCTGLNTVTFKGDAPSIADYTFAKVKATVYYPGENETWTQDKLKNYGGTLTWKKN